MNIHDFIMKFRGDFSSTMKLALLIRRFQVILPVAFVGAVNTLVSVYAAHSAGDMYLCRGEGTWTMVQLGKLGTWSHVGPLRTENWWLLVGVSVPRWPAFWGDSWCFSQRRVSPVLCLSSAGTCICPANMETLRCLKSAGPQNFPKGLNSISDIFRMTYISCFQTHAKMACILSRSLNLIGGLEHEFYFFHNIWDNHPNWRIHIFQRGRYTTNQCYIILYIYIYLAVSPSFWVKRTQFIDGFFSLQRGWNHQPVMVSLLTSCGSPSKHRFRYPIRECLIVDGLTTVVAALFGSPFGTCVYCGHPQFKQQVTCWACRKKLEIQKKIDESLPT